METGSENQEETSGSAGTNPSHDPSSSEESTLTPRQEPDTPTTTQQDKGSTQDWPEPEPGKQPLYPPPVVRWQDTIDTDEKEKQPVTDVEQPTQQTSESGPSNGQEDDTPLTDRDWTERDEKYYGGRVPMYYQSVRNYSETGGNEPRARGSERFHEILGGLGDLHDQKQRDYGTGTDPFANVRASESFGIPAWLGAVVRANDKMRRLMTAGTQVTAGQKISMANESIEDSLRDLAVYAIIALVLFEEE